VSPSIAVPVTPRATGQMAGLQSGERLTRSSSWGRACPTGPVAARPTWARLYAILPTSAALYALVYMSGCEGFWRIAAELGVAAITMTLLALWIAANRTVRAHLEATADTVPLHVLYFFLPESAAMRPGCPGASLRRTGQPGAVPDPAPESP
jgi:hypothetical protein